MAKCDSCGSTFFLSQLRDGTRRFCSPKCYQNSLLMALTEQVPHEVLAARVDEVHQGACPQCKRSGPVDLHTSHDVWSIIVMTRWSDHPHLVCRSCGVKKQLASLLGSALLGWWGLPWGVVMTPVQIVRNITGMLRPPNPAVPSAQLHRLVCLNLAASLRQSSPPPLPAAA